MSDALKFIGMMWSAIALTTGIAMTFALLLWPFSSRPLFCLITGAAGALLSLAGAFGLTQLTRAKQ